MHPADDSVLVVSRTQAARILNSPSKRRGIRFVVSIGTVSEPPPAGLRNVPHRIRLLFEDESTPGCAGPTEGDIRRLVEFARSVDLSAGRLLSHCQAGISRSSAAAVIVLAVSTGSLPVDIAGWLHRTHPDCNPNRLMLKLADEILANGGALIAAWPDGGPMTEPGAD